MLLKLLLNGDIRLFVSKFVSYPLLPTVYCPTCTPLQILSLPLLLKLVYSSAQKNGENENWTQCASQALMGPTQSCDLILCLSKTFAIFTIQDVLDHYYQNQSKKEIKSLQFFPLKQGKAKISFYRSILELTLASLQWTNINNA